MREIPSQIRIHTSGFMAQKASFLIIKHFFGCKYEQGCSLQEVSTICKKQHIKNIPCTFFSSSLRCA